MIRGAGAPTPALYSNRTAVERASLRYALPQRARQYLHHHPARIKAACPLFSDILATFRIERRSTWCLRRAVTPPRTTRAAAQVALSAMREVRACIELLARVAGTFPPVGAEVELHEHPDGWRFTRATRSRRTRRGLPCAPSFDSTRCSRAGSFSWPRQAPRGGIDEANGYSQLETQDVGKAG